MVDREGQSEDNEGGEEGTLWLLSEVFLHRMEYVLEEIEHTTVHGSGDTLRGECGVGNLHTHTHYIHVQPISPHFKCRENLSQPLAVYTVGGPHYRLCTLFMYSILTIF